MGRPGRIRIRNAVLGIQQTRSRLAVLVQIEHEHINRLVPYILVLHGHPAHGTQQSRAAEHRSQHGLVRCRVITVKQVGDPVVVTEHLVAVRPVPGKAHPAIRLRNRQQIRRSQQRILHPDFPQIQGSVQIDGIGHVQLETRLERLQDIARPLVGRKREPSLGIAVRHASIITRQAHLSGSHRHTVGIFQHALQHELLPWRQGDIHHPVGIEIIHDNHRVGIGITSESHGHRVGKRHIRHVPLPVRTGHGRNPLAEDFHPDSFHGLPAQSRRHRPGQSCARAMVGPKRNGRHIVGYDARLAEIELVRTFPVLVDPIAGSARTLVSDPVMEGTEKLRMDGSHRHQAKVPSVIHKSRIQLERHLVAETFEHHRIVKDKGKILFRNPASRQGGKVGIGHIKTERPCFGHPVGILVFQGYTANHARFHPDLARHIDNLARARTGRERERNPVLAHRARRARHVISARFHHLDRNPERRVVGSQQIPLHPGYHPQLLHTRLVGRVRKPDRAFLPGIQKGDPVLGSQHSAGSVHQRQAIRVTPVQARIADRSPYHSLFPRLEIIGAIHIPHGHVHLQGRLQDHIADEKPGRFRSFRNHAERKVIHPALVHGERLVRRPGIINQDRRSTQRPGKGIHRGRVPEPDFQFFLELEIQRAHLVPQHVRRASLQFHRRKDQPVVSRVGACLENRSRLAQVLPVSPCGIILIGIDHSPRSPGTGIREITGEISLMRLAHHHVPCPGRRPLSMLRERYDGIAVIIQNRNPFIRERALPDYPFHRIRVTDYPVLETGLIDTPPELAAGRSIPRQGYRAVFRPGLQIPHRGRHIVAHHATYQGKPPVPVGIASPHAIVMQAVRLVLQGMLASFSRSQSVFHGSHQLPVPENLHFGQGCQSLAPFILGGVRPRQNDL